MDDKTLEMTMLLDFFGELLTEKQREYFDLYYNDDLSLSEIAETAGISRQGVRDQIRRAEELLSRTEEKTGVVRRFREMQKTIADIGGDLERLRLLVPDGEAQETVRSISEKLDTLKG